MTKRNASGAQAPSLVWFRDDLRLADNPALHAAVARGAPVRCVFILEEGDDGPRPHGAASLWWLHHSLEALADSLQRIGGRLDLFRGPARDIIPALVDATRPGAVFWNRRYDKGGIAVDTALKTAIAARDVAVESFNGRLIHEPWEIKTKAGGAYGVYTPYWRAALERGDGSHPLPAPRAIEAADGAPGPKPLSLADLNMLPTKPDWSAGFKPWTPGEAGAMARLQPFLKDGLDDYGARRDQLAVEGTSRLSPHLRFGEISPRQVVAMARAAVAKRSDAEEGAKKFIAEIGWREFDYHVMFHNPNVASVNLHRQFDAMPWREPVKAEVDAWKRGRTGYPVVDAGMRELWVTGTMHNRVRMITASFLIKHLLCDWRVGEAWFWDCLCDADPANNPMNWQWVAGSGADAAPFFRVFNPIVQGQKFDPKGDYVRAHVPELAKLPASVIHEPWKASPEVLARAGVKRGETYPAPIVDHAEARARALAAYEAVKR
jgi:deoxyribodipyrimidine photo-lyase